MEKVLLGMSGGVDSTAAVLLLKEQGLTVVGAYLQMHGDTDPQAIKAAEKLAVDFCSPDCKEAFDRMVKDFFVESYQMGDTPNPCVRCNKTVKFPQLLKAADEMGCRYIATGHYARVQYDDKTGRYQILRALDRKKDQSYVLYGLSQEVLSRLLLPLGTYEKPVLRTMVREAGVENADRGDSQDICFIPDGDYVEFLKDYGKLAMTEGDFVDEAGNVLGRHKGFEGYTKGQRRGLGVSYAHPLYVLGKNRQENTVTLGAHEGLFTDHLTAGEVNWVSIAPPTEPITVTAKTRYSQTEAAATVIPLEDGTIRVTFETPQRAITEGQSVVLYDGDLLLGGGIITETD